MTQVLAAAIAAGDLTREGVANAVAAQTGIDFRVPARPELMPGPPMST